jgi:DNA ligase (NAD+)
MSTPSKKKSRIQSSNSKEIAKNQKIQAEMKGLEKEIRSHQYFYYLENSPKITDKDFDLTFSEIKKTRREIPRVSELR